MYTYTVLQVHCLQCNGEKSSSDSIALSLLTESSAQPVVVAGWPGRPGLDLRQRHTRLGIQGWSGLLPLAAGLPACWEHKRTGGQPVRRLGLLDLQTNLTSARFDLERVQNVLW